jgi:Ca2+-transporting ATPase
LSCNPFECFDYATRLVSPRGTESGLAGGPLNPKYLVRRVQLLDETSTPWHAASAEDALVELSTNRGNGLTTPEAKRRMAVYGPNSMEYSRRFSAVLIFLGQFKNSLVIILLIAVSVSALLGEILDALVIALIVFLVAVTGFLQEYRAEGVFAALRERLSPTCTIVRDGRPEILAVAEIVPGDIVLLETGVRVPADTRLIEVAALQIEESSLTGESMPVVKRVEPVPEDVPVGERANMAYAGTAVAYGRARGVVVATGARTEFGNIIEKTVEVEEEETPLERQVNLVGKKFGVMALGVIVAVGLAEFSRESFSGSLSLSGFVAILLFGIALGVAAVPEALPAVITTNLAIGMRILARNNTLVRKMSAVETLGSTEIICFDKTGTLTKGEMTVRMIYADDETFEVTGIGYAPGGSITRDGHRQERMPGSLTELGRASLLCNDARLQIDSDGRWEVIGDPTEGALLVLARKIGLDPSFEHLPRIAEIPFSSERKMMTTLHRTGDGGLVGYTKGAPEFLLPCCAMKFTRNEFEELHTTDRDEISKASERLSSSGMRVLALAFRRFGSEAPNWEGDIGCDFVFLGLVGMEDPLRQEAVEAVKHAVNAGMLPIMITGDHRTTAVVIAERAGIFKPGDQVLTGKELQEIPDDELTAKVRQVTVYARISPIDKLRIVNAWKQMGKVVAMTGDGVNDAPALRRADIGVAMGVSGTDVAKEAADIVLTDDNFASIVKAVELGRWIYDNIRKYLAYLLQANLVEIVVLGSIALVIGPLFGLEGGALPLLPVQILYINLATDGLPALALGFSPADSELALKPPRPRDESVFTVDITKFLISTILIQVPLLLLGFTTGLASGIDAARTRLFLMFIFMELALAINCRSISLTLRKAKPHFWLLISIAWESSLILVLLQFPQARGALHLSVPRADDMYWILGGVLLTFASSEIFKNLRARGSNPLRHEPIISGPLPTAFSQRFPSGLNLRSGARSE